MEEVTTFTVHYKDDWGCLRTQAFLTRHTAERFANTIGHLGCEVIGEIIECRFEVSSSGILTAIRHGSETKPMNL
jgi:hypothetical protein